MGIHESSRRRSGLLAMRRIKGAEDEVGTNGHVRSRTQEVCRMGETVRRVIVVNSSTEMENIESIDRVIASDPMLSSPVRKGGKRMASWTSKANWSLFGKWASRIHPWCDYC